MKIFALEEHLATPAIIDAWRTLDPATKDFAIPMSIGQAPEEWLRDLGDKRIAAMDEAGIDVMVLSQTAPGVQSLEGETAIALARDANDIIARTVRGRPGRFQGFATLPTASPKAAARELDRAINELGLHGAMLFGRTGDRNLDHPDFLPILEKAAELRAPLYIHPQSPQPAVLKACYEGLGDGVETVFATGGIGWHYETGLQVLRLILAGTFDRLPDLRVILGHWGEVVLFYLDRIDIATPVAKLPRPISDYFRTNVWVTPGGIYSQRYLRWATEVIGIDRIMMATDFPYQLSSGGEARRFLEDADLGDDDRRLVASGNWERLVADIRRQGEA